jgi:hypothetical protein
LPASFGAWRQVFGGKSQLTPVAAGAGTVSRKAIIGTVERENGSEKPVNRREQIVAAATLFGQSGA